jgi:type IV pilus assembly protein PilM
VSKTRVIGLDIGTTAVRAAEVEIGRGGSSGDKQPTVVRFGQAPLPLGAVRDGEVAEPETVATAIRQLWQQHKFSHKDVVLGLGNQRVMVRDLAMPAMPMAQLRSSLPYQVQDMLPVDVDDVLLDYYPSGSFQGSTGPMVSGLLVAATKDTVHANTAAVETAGLRPLMVDLTAFALTRYQARGELAQGTVALVDIGAKVTIVVIASQGVPRLVRILPGGGQDATDAIANDVGVASSEAENIKRQVGVGYAVSAELRSAAEAVSRSTQNLVEAIRNTLVYYAANNPGHAARVLVLTGGGSQLAGLGQYLSSASRMNVTYGHPLSTLRPGSGLPQGDQLAQLGHVLAVPVGLALGDVA